LAHPARRDWSGGTGTDADGVLRGKTGAWHPSRRRILDETLELENRSWSNATAEQGDNRRERT
jgi:hypothetical protein